MSALPKIPSEMTVAEFLNWDAPAPYRWQLVNGEPQMMAPGSPTHSRVQAELARLIGNHLVEHNWPCSVFVEVGVLPKAKADVNFRIPDLAVTCADPKTVEAYLEAPVLLVEILSPSNKAETWSNVWTYTTIPSVKEILILRSDAIGAELLRRNEDGTWPAETIKIGSGIVALESIGFLFELTEAYRGTRLV